MDLIVQTARLPSGRRLVTGISEVEFDEGTQNYRIVDIFALAEDPAAGGEGDPDPAARYQLAWTRTRPATFAQLQVEGLTGQMDLTRAMLAGPDGPGSPA